VTGNPHKKNKKATAEAVAFVLLLRFVGGDGAYCTEC